MKRHQKGGPSIRMLRVNENIRHAISDILQRGDTHSQDLEGVSITVAEVRTSPDLRHATVYVMPLGDKNRDDVLKSLNIIAPKLSGRVARQVRLKFTPRLKFEADTTFDESSKINKILSHPRVAPDLEGEDSD